MREPRLTFKEMCARFDVTPRTLRYYEYIELLQPEREGRTRMYGPREVARMTLIRRARRFGIPLEEARQWLDLYHLKGTRAQLEAALDLIDRQSGFLRERQAELAETLEELARLRGEISSSLDKKA